MSLLRRSVFITFFSTNAYAALQFGVTLVLARLLTPAEIGIFSMTVVITNIAAVFRDFGVTAYLQREKDLTPEKMRSAFGFLLTTSWTIAICLYFFSSVAARFYGEAGVGEVMQVLSLSFVLLPFASFFYAVLARNLEAGKQAVVNGVGTLTYAVSCLTLAWQGMSYLAPAWASVLNIASTVIAYLCLKTQHVPLRPAFSHWREIARFGMGALAGGVASRADAALPDLVLGKISGPHSVGLYSRATGLINIFTQIAGPTLGYNTIPFLARAFHEGRSLGELLHKACLYLTVVSWPVFICIAVFPVEIIRLLYGSQWVPAAPIAVVLACVAVLNTGISLWPHSMTAIGKPYLAALPTLVSIGMRLSMIFLLQAKQLIDFAIAIAIADLLTVFVPLWLMSRHMGFTPRLVLDAYWTSAKVCVPCLVVALALKFALPQGTPDVVALLLLSALVILTWIVAVVRTGHPLRLELPGVVNKLLPARWAQRIVRYL